MTLHQITAAAAAAPLTLLTGCGIAAPAHASLAVAGARPRAAELPAGQTGSVARVPAFIQVRY